MKQSSNQTEKQVAQSTENTPRIMERVAAHMLKTRPRKEVVFRPYYRREGVRQKALLGGVTICFGEAYGKAALQSGSKIFVKTAIVSGRKEEAFLNLKGDHGSVFYEDRELVPEIEDEKGSCFRLKVGEEPAELVVECPFPARELNLVVSTVYYRGMEAKDYLSHIRLLSPYRSPECEVEGVALSAVCPMELSYRNVDFSVPFEQREHIVDFQKAYPTENGKVAYAFSECARDGEVQLFPCSPCRIEVWDGTEVKRQNADSLRTQERCCRAVRSEARKGAEGDKAQERSDGIRVTLKKGNRLLIRSVREKERWGFTCQGECLKLPFLYTKPSGEAWEDRQTENERTEGKQIPEILGKFLLAGTFAESENPDAAYGPDFRLWSEWGTPFRNAQGNPCYWKTVEEHIFLRPYLDTCFFGQWFYALMVGNYGLLQAAEYLGRRDWQNYVLESLQIPAQYYEYQKYDKELFGESTFLQRAMQLDNLDAIGAMGMCLAENYKRTGRADIKALLLTLAEAAQKNIPRFEDGTYHRESTMWADDTFMSIPFLARMWEITGEAEYLKECVRQLKGFAERLYMEEKKLFSHIYFLNEKTANRIPWGRGNGWVFLSLSDLLYILYRHGLWNESRFGSSGEKMQKRCNPLSEEELAFLKELQRNFAAGLMACQDEEGMLHQILDDVTSYQETSCTGMFVIGLSYGIFCGTLEADYLGAAQNAMRALEEKCVDRDGTIRGVCRGSWCSMERKYYKELGTVDDDDHGTGIFLWAQTALAQACKKDRLEKNR